MEEDYAASLSWPKTNEVSPGYAAAGFRSVAPQTSPVNLRDLESSVIESIQRTEGAENIRRVTLPPETSHLA